MEPEYGRFYPVLECRSCKCRFRLEQVHYTDLSVGWTDKPSNLYFHKCHPEVPSIVGLADFIHFELIDKDQPVQFKPFTRLRS